MAKPVTSNPTGEARVLITLEISQIGFQIRGLGSGAYDPKIIVQGQQLVDFLNELIEKMLHAKEKLNKKWAAFDTNSHLSPSNISTVEMCLRYATRAFATTMELTPYQAACAYGPTDPLRKIYIQRLEEIFTKCFTVAWMYGNPEQSMIGLRGLITDFQVNGGVDTSNGKEGKGMYLSLCEYHRAHFEPNDRGPLVYQKFALMIRKLSETVERYHPLCRVPLAESIRLMASGGQCFRPELTSSAKTEALQDILAAADRLAPTKIARGTYSPVFEMVTTGP